MTARTSETHPLKIATVDVPGATGRIGVTFCPGKKQPNAATGAWDRDLHTDMSAIREWGADTLVSLVEEDEMSDLGVKVIDMNGATRDHEVAWVHLPIRDVSAPDIDFELAWVHAGPALREDLRAGRDLVVHCKGGLGRAGTVAARLLIEAGVDVEEAMERVRKARPGAIETDAQEAYLRSLPTPDRRSGRRPRDEVSGIAFGERTSRSDRDRLNLTLPWDLELARASLLGGMYGDAVGAKLEFIGSVPEMHRARLTPPTNSLPETEQGEWTDDSQMTLFTLEGFGRGVHRARTRGFVYMASVVHHALLRWYVTQGGRPQMEIDREVGLIRFSGERANAFPRRAPGSTCLDALAAAKEFGEPARNDSKGCGTIMRVAPIGLLAPRHLVRETAIETSALTHGHPTGQLAASAWAEMLADVADGEDLEAVARRVGDAYAGLPNGAETADAIGKALDAPRDGRWQTAESLGGGWVAEECLAIALYACLASRPDGPRPRNGYEYDRGDPFMDGIDVAVLHGGDSDSTGAVAGNMLGLMYPHLATTHFVRKKLGPVGGMFVNILLKEFASVREASEYDDPRVDFLSPW